jgi:hypothetical protein
MSYSLVGLNSTEELYSGLSSKVRIIVARDWRVETVFSSKMGMITNVHISSSLSTPAVILLDRIAVISERACPPFSPRKYTKLQPAALDLKPSSRGCCFGRSSLPLSNRHAFTTVEMLGTDRHYFPGDTDILPRG